MKAFLESLMGYLAIGLIGGFTLLWVSAIFSAMGIVGCGVGDLVAQVPEEAPTLNANCVAEPGKIKEFQGMLCPTPYFARGVKSISPNVILCSEILVNCKNDGGKPENLHNVGKTGFEFDEPANPGNRCCRQGHCRECQPDGHDNGETEYDASRDSDFYGSERAEDSDS